MRCDWMNYWKDNGKPFLWYSTSYNVCAVNVPYVSPSYENRSIVISLYITNTWLHLVPHITLLASSHFEAKTLSVDPIGISEDFHIRGTLWLMISLTVWLESLTSVDWRLVIKYSNTDFIISSINNYDLQPFRISLYYRRKYFVRLFVLIVTQ